MSNQDAPTDTKSLPEPTGDRIKAEPIAYRLKDAPAITGLSMTTLRRHVASGALPSRLVGGCRVLLREDLERFLKGEL